MGSKTKRTDVHDLFSFLVSTSDEIASEYDRIRPRVTEDPGTAGDQGEKNWKTLLENWIPPQYHVVTKGRILGHEGAATPQIDVLVLHPGYPKGLLDKNLYLAGGVAAAFECKLTLRSEHIRKAVENAVKIRSLLPRRNGSVYREVYSPIVYGVLAHSHEWKGHASTPIENVDQALHAADTELVKHPREMLDVLCVADLATWTARKTFSYFASGSATGTSYALHVVNNAAKEHVFRPVAVLISFIFRMLAHEDPSLRELAHYLQMVGVEGCAKSERCRTWPLDTVSSETQNLAAAGYRSEDNPTGLPQGFFP